MGPGTRTRPGRLLPHLLLAAALPVRCDDWLLNDPAVFHRRADLALLDGLGNFSQDPLAMATLTGLLERHMQTKDGSSDLEVRQKGASLTTHRPRDSDNLHTSHGLLTYLSKETEI